MQRVSPTAHPVTAGQGPHTSRTMMLAEVERLFEEAPAESGVDTYREAVVNENVLGKATAGSRQRAFRALRELYVLDPGDSAFRVLRFLWDDDPAGRPLLALLQVLRRDPLLRATTPIILTKPEGAPVCASELSAALASEFGGISQDSVDKIGRYVASTWTQSRHVRGRVNKKRSKAVCTAPVAAYAAFLGNLDGVAGQGLFETLYARACDRSPYALRELAYQASRRGLIEYREMGTVIELSFRRLLEPELLHVSAVA
jgi:hypothetical protein